MKRISFFLALALIVASFGMAGANSVTVDAITGNVWVDNNAGGVTKLFPGGSFNIDVRVTNTEGKDIGGIANGFQYFK